MDSLTQDILKYNDLIHMTEINYHLLDYKKILYIIGFFIIIIIKLIIE